MTDIFHEVQEDLRRDRMQALWKRYGGVVVAVAAIVVAGVGGWRAYEHFQAKAAQEAGDRYQAAAKLSQDGKGDEARKAFADLAASGPVGYQSIARLREADEVAKTDKAGALKLYQALAADNAADGMMRDTARLRGAYIASDIGSVADVRNLADPLASSGGPYASLAREAIGLAAYKAGDAAEARRQFEAIVGEGDTPGSVRQRADLMLAVLPPATEAGKTDAPKADAPKTEAPKPAN